MEYSSLGPYFKLDWIIPPIVDECRFCVPMYKYYKPGLNLCRPFCKEGKPETVQSRTYQCVRSHLYFSYLIRVLYSVLVYSLTGEKSQFVVTVQSRLHSYAMYNINTLVRKRISKQIASSKQLGCWKITITVWTADLNNNIRNEFNGIESLHNGIHIALLSSLLRPLPSLTATILNLQPNKYRNRMLCPRNPPGWYID